MTGEMYTITQDGVSDDNEQWPLHAAVSRAIGGTLKPFDYYQGPYILLGEDVRIGRKPYDYPVMHVGVVRLWIFQDKRGMGRIYREDTDTTSDPFHWDDEETAINLAKEILKGKKKEGEG